MAIFEINSGNTDVDTQKLKREIESSSIVLNARVLNIEPNSGGVKVIIDADATTSQAEINTLKTIIIDAHSSLLRKRVLVHDLPDANGAASNKEYVDSLASDILDDAKTYVDNKVAEEVAKLVGTAPTILDTLGELSDALGDDPNFATTVSNRIGAAEDRLDDLENRPNIIDLDSISDVAITSPTNNQVLKYTGTQWENSNLAPVAITGSYDDLNDKPILTTSLSELTDVTITAPQANHVLKYDGTEWINSEAPPTFSGSYQDLTDTPDLSVYATDAELAEVSDRITELEYNSFITREVPVGVVNGTNTAFTLSSTPILGSEQVFLNGILLEPGVGNDYTISENIITFSAAPSVGWKILVSYATGNYLVSPAIPITITSPTTNQYLKYNGTSWVNSNISAVDVGGLATVATSGSYLNLTDTPAIPNTISSLNGDVAISSPAQNELLQYNGTKWTNAPAPSGVPTGTVVSFAGSTAPSGWLLCDGSQISRTTYASLFATIGSTYGNGNGSTTFNLPDLRGRTVAGVDNMGGADAGRLSWSNTLGTAAGSETHTLIEGEMPSHTHIQNAHNHTQNAHSHGLGYGAWISGGGIPTAYFEGNTSGSSERTTSDTATNNPTTATNQNTGGNQAHNNMQPTILLNYIIKA